MRVYIVYRASTPKFNLKVDDQLDVYANFRFLALISSVLLLLLPLELGLELNSPNGNHHFESLFGEPDTICDGLATTRRHERAPFPPMMLYVIKANGLLLAALLHMRVPR